jgi:lipoyl(octanoyl) transferase
MERQTTIIIRQLGMQAYAATFARMQAFTLSRTEATPDEIWLLEHPPVFTQGQAGKPEHILDPGNIPVVQTDRGGQVTYHGPGQLVAYFLLDLRRLGFGIRRLVTLLENSVVATLGEYGIHAAPRSDAPGVYVDGAKICSLGLRVRHGCSYHGIAFNVNMDLSPFLRINPCGFKDLNVTQVHDFSPDTTVATVAGRLIPHLCSQFGYTNCTLINEVEEAHESTTTA